MMNCIYFRLYVVKCCTFSPFPTFPFCHALLITNSFIFIYYMLCYEQFIISYQLCTHINSHITIAGRVFFGDISVLSLFVLCMSYLSYVDEVQKFNFLGITIDQNITWTPHIRKISIKISRVICVLRKLKHIFPQHILRLIYNSIIHPHLIYGLNLWGFKHKHITILQKKAVRILAFRPYISHSTSAFKELKIPMLKDLYTIQLYKIYYKNIHNILPVYFQRFLPNFNNGLAHNHNLRHQALRLPMTRKEYYVQSTKYQLFKLIRETPQLDLDRCLTSSLVQFVAYFKYKIIEAYNAVCNIRNCYVCQ